MDKKIIICYGDAHTPPRFWAWHICNKEEVESFKRVGWATSTCKRFLTKEQIIELEGDASQ